MVFDFCFSFPHPRRCLGDELHGPWLKFNRPKITAVSSVVLSDKVEYEIFLRSQMVPDDSARKGHLHHRWVLVQRAYRLHRSVQTQVQNRMETLWETQEHALLVRSRADRK